MNLILSSPRTVSNDARDAKWLLSGNNRFAKTDLPIHTYRGAINRTWDLEGGHAANRARFWLGYPKGQGDQAGRFGPQIYSYLLPLDNPLAKKLPAAYRARRALRIRAELKRLKAIEAKKEPKVAALAIARSQLGIREFPYGSNSQKFGRWFGFDEVPWCAIFVSFCLRNAGWKRARTALAYQWEWWARSNQRGLSITYNPEPGDIVVYHLGQGHVGIFDRWTNRSSGEFLAIEGNTSQSSDDNGGEVQQRRRSKIRHRAVFVRVN